MRTTITIFALFTMFFGICTAQADDDRPPTHRERAKIEKVLQSNGFTRWKGIEFDDGRWEVDDAMTADGHEFDLKLDPTTLEIVKRERD